MSLPSLLAALLLTALASWAATGAVLRLLRGWQVLDEPNHRSSHQVATPRGGGLAVIAVVALAWVGGATVFDPLPPGFGALLGGLLMVAVVSWLDDLRSLPAALRLAVQAAAVTLALWTGGEATLVFGGALPPLLDHVVVGLMWLWFINLFNFMDGIDGIAAVESLCIAGGLALCAGMAGLDDGLAFWAASLAAAALGFLYWNWAPARIFLGDVGSIPLGYLLGWLLILLAAEGYWAAALILPLYYLVDASWTLCRRTLKGEAPWNSHRQHLYQKAVQRGFSHAAVSTRILICNGLLIALAVIATRGQPWSALGLACLAVAVLVFMLSRQGPPAKRRQHPGKPGAA